MRGLTRNVKTNRQCLLVGTDTFDDTFDAFVGTLPESGHGGIRSQDRPRSENRPAQSQTQSGLTPMEIIRDVCYLRPRR